MLLNRPLRAARPLIFRLVLLLSVGFTLAPVPVNAAPDARNLIVTDVAGKPHLLSKSRSRATVLFFVAHDCPISNAYAPEINRIISDYSARKVDFFVVYADSDLSVADARQHARQYGYHVPLLRDSKHLLNASLGVKVTPEAVLLSPSGQRLYVGRINDRYIALGKKRRQVAHHELRDALDETLNAKSVSHPEVRAIGCFIPAPSQ